MTSVEKRTAHKIELRANESGGTTLEGYAAVFNSPTGIGDYFVEQIAPGAFADTIKGDVRCLFNHQSGNVLGRTKSGTLRLSEDAHGLRFEVDIPNTTLGNDVRTLVERGDISGCSFDFLAVKQTWDDTGDMPSRTLQKVEINEISIVTFPAYTDTTVAVRSLDEWRSANAPTPEITDPAAAPVIRADAIKARLKMDLDIKVRSTR
ncbi:HK97 family phage prohead protease [Rhizobium leucaenae]|uniref:HK97 family phage prohead protease n=1 Tax=Rhizobium leucaenae TaxID=29450 RepID=UPI00041A633E|nr:HK97 family phage prohead protease [Rhizobium leucaenae]